MFLIASNFVVRALILMGLWTSAESNPSALVTASELQGNQHLCFEVKLTPFRGGDGKVSGKGSGTATIHIDPKHLSYTRTIVFADLSSPTDASYVHDKLMNLPGFPVKVRGGTYTQTFPSNPAHAAYFKDLEGKFVGILLALNANDILHGNAYSPCQDTTPSKSLRGSIGRSNA